ncbi:MAG: hypothetical protein ACT4OI_08515 [Methanobacteriota archaeon]
MSPERIYGARSPRGWLFLAFLGVWVYLISQVLKVYNAVVADMTALSPGDVLSLLAITSGLGSVLVFAGLVSALWRANLAAGLSGAGVRGLVLGASGVGVLLVFAIALVLAFLGFGGEFVAALTRVRDIGDVLGTALAFAGLASLGVGLAHATSLFRRPARVPRPSESAQERAEPP